MSKSLKNILSKDNVLALRNACNVLLAEMRKQEIASLQPRKTKEQRLHDQFEEELQTKYQTQRRKRK